MRVLIAGGSGFIGRSLAQMLSKKGATLTLLTRGNQELGCYSSICMWDALAELSAKDFDLIINLCGDDISAYRWSIKRKEEIISSRVESTRRIIQFIGEEETLFMCASAIGGYPFSIEVQHESHQFEYKYSNSGFCQEVVSKIELEVSGSNLKSYLLLRFGVVLGDHGVIKKLLPTAKLGMGMVFGNGAQLITWIHIEDLCRAVIHLYESNKYNKEVVNLTSPNPCTQKELINILCSSINRPRFLFMLKPFVYIIFGQMGVELLLSSHNIKPKKLLDSNFKFNYLEISKAINNLILKDHN
jgi:uncharacterized protein